MNSQVIIRRSLFPWGFNQRFSLQLAQNKGQLIELLDAVAQHLLPQMVYTEPSIANIKGADSQTLIDIGAISPARTSAEELFAACGEIAAESPEQTALSWDLKVRTKFLEFDRSGGIKHQLEIIHSDSLPQYYSAADTLRNIGRFLPLSPWALRFGADFFRAQRISAMLGLTPTIISSIRMSANQTNLKLELHQFSRTITQQIPLAEAEMRKQLSKVFSQIYKINLEQEYQQAKSS